MSPTRSPLSALILLVLTAAVPGAATPARPPETPAQPKSGVAAKPETAAKPEEPGSKNPRIMVEIQGVLYNVGKPVWVRVTTRNDGDTPVPNPLTDPVAAGLSLQDSSGKSYKPSAAGAAAPDQRPGTLAARTLFGQVIDAGRLFPVLAQKGKYTLSYAGRGAAAQPVILHLIQPYNAESTYAATIKTRFGELKLDFFPKDAPITVRNFVDLARMGFYDGLTFHYVRPGEVVAGGDPKGDGTGGSGFFIPPEFNERKHLAGTVAMMRLPAPDASASSQFYICLAPQPERDGQFTVFAQVVKGMDVLKKIGEVPTSGRKEQPYFKPLEPVVIESVTIQETPGKASS